MALSSNGPAMLSLPISEKLSRDNFLLWKAQILPAIKGTRFVGILSGTSKALAPTISIEKAEKSKEDIVNPKYETWMAQDQQLLSYIINSLTKEVLASVITVTTIVEAWIALDTMYSVQSCARAPNLRMQLSMLKKGNMSIAAYYAKLKAYVDELATIGKPIEDDEMVTFILLGHDLEYNPIVTSFMGRTDPIYLNNLYAHLVAYETRLDMLSDNYNNNNGGFSSSANSANQRRVGYQNQGGNGGGRGRGRGSGGRGNNTAGNHDQQRSSKGTAKPKCQICKKAGH